MEQNINNLPDALIKISNQSSELKYIQHLLLNKTKQIKKLKEKIEELTTRNIEYENNIEMLIKRKLK